MADARLAAMRAARHAGLPAPELEARVDVDGESAVLLAYLPGVPLLELMTRQPASATHWAGAMGSLQRRLHGILAPVGLPDVVSHAGHPFGAARAADVPDGDALLHLDWHPGNLLADANGAISGILDWDNARRGHPMLDLARTESILTVEPGLDRLPDAIRALLPEVRAAWSAAYGPEASAIPTACRRWAGRVMLADLAPRYPASSALLDPARRWAERGAL